MADNLMPYEPLGVLARAAPTREELARDILLKLLEGAKEWAVQSEANNMHRYRAEQAVAYADALLSALSKKEIP